MKQWLMVLATAALTAACGTDAPTPGNLVVSLGGTGVARGLSFTVAGKLTAVASPAGKNYRVFSFAALNDSTRIAVIAPVGQSLAAGAIVSLTVPDTRAAAQYHTVVADVAGANYQLVSATPFTLTVSRP